eukprot:5956968-Prymnesium_polylepis.1
MVTIMSSACAVLTMSCGLSSSSSDCMSATPSAVLSSLLSPVSYRRLPSSSSLRVERGAQLLDRLVDRDARLAHVLQLVGRDVGQFVQDARRHLPQRVARPLVPPVDGRVVDERRVLPQPVAQRVADGRKAERHVDVLAAVAQEVDAQLGGARLFAVLARALAVVAQRAEDSLELVLREERRDLAVVEHVRDVLVEGLLHRLRVVEQEDHLGPVAPALQQHLLHVVAPLGDRVLLRHLHLEHAQLLDVRREPRERLAARAADADEHQVAVRLREHARDAAQVGDGVDEHDELHRVLGERVVRLEVA